VRDVAFAPSAGLPVSILATCSQVSARSRPSCLVTVSVASKRRVLPVDRAGVRRDRQDKQVFIWSKEREDAPWTKVRGTRPCPRRGRQPH